MGVECDGASYHSSRSARDRDRLRQQVLEDRGWVIHRIWSTDWLHQPEEQLRQLLAAIETAKADWTTRGKKSIDQCIDSPLVDTEPDIARSDTGQALVAKSAPVPPYVEAAFRVDTNRQIHELTSKELATVVT